MTWYGEKSPVVRQLQSIIERKPNLSQLLCFSDFIQQLKSYNPSLLEYLSNSQSIPIQLVDYLTTTPTEQDSPQRQYKIPYLTVQMVETETICIINCFYKIDQQGKTYLQAMFRNLFKTSELLPLLAGYFYRVNACLINSKPKQSTEVIYSSDAMNFLVIHSYNAAIANTLQLYLNLEQSKHPYIHERVDLKINVINRIFENIKLKASKRGQQSYSLIQNLCSVIVNILDRYYLITDGKIMVQTILKAQNIQLMCGIMLSERQQRMSVMNFFLSALRYCSCLPLNTEENKDNQKRLEQLPLVVIMLRTFQSAFQKITQCDRMTLYLYKLLEVYCHCTTLSSFKILQKLRHIGFYSCLIDLLIKHETCSILHMLIERAFLHIFVTQHPIYEFYKNHIFCEVGVIDLTAGRLVSNFKNLQQAQKHGYYGSLVKIIKIYSNIQTSNEAIATSIKSKSQLWKKLSQSILKPYEQISGKDLGTYDLEDPIVNTFTVRRSQSTLHHNLINNATVIEEVNREEAVPNVKIELSEVLREESKETTPIIEYDNFFKVPIPSQSTTQGQQIKKKEEESKQNGQVEEKKELKKSQSFKQFLTKNLVVAEKEIKIQRSTSYDKKMSNSKTRLVSPSPRKKNSWKEEEEDKNKSYEQPKPTKNKIPHLPNIKTNSSVIIVPDQPPSMTDNRLAKSMVDLSQYGKIQLVRVQNPINKQYRKFGHQDKAIFQLLGIISS